MLRLRQLREENGLTRAELGGKAGVHPSHVGAIENGRQVPSGDSVTLHKLAIALDWRKEPVGLLEEVNK